MHGRFAKYPWGNTFGFRQPREQRREKCGLCPTTLHFSRPLIGGRQATVVQMNTTYLGKSTQSLCLSRSGDLPLPGVIGGKVLNRIPPLPKKSYSVLA